MSELRQAVRALRGAPWYAVTIIAVMALCVSLSTTVFAIVDGVLFKPLPYARPAELYLMTGGYLNNKQRSGISVAPRNVRDWTAAVPGAVSTLLETGMSASVFGDVRGWVPIVGRIDAHFFDVMGLRPLVGGFSDADFADAESTTKPAMISYGVWQSKLGGRPDAVGQTLTVDATHNYRVAGVLPRDFLFPWFGEAPELLLPLTVDPARLNDLRYRQFSGIVRLPTTESLATMQSRMDAAAASEKADWVPRPSDGTPVFDHANLERLDYQMSRLQRPFFSLAFGAAGILMLLGCLNISGLIASRALDRRHGISLRRALGGSAGDIARLLVIENAVVVGAGAALGALIASPMATVTMRLLPRSMALLKNPGVDARVMAFTIALALVATAIVSIWPVWRSVRLPAVPYLQDGGRSSGRALTLGRFVVVTLQVAIGLVLTLGGTLLVGSLMEVWRIDPGYASDQVIVLRGRKASTVRAERNDAIENFERAVRGVPGVSAVSSTQSPFGGGMMMNAFMDGATVAVRPGFFETMGMTLVEGRWPTEAEITSGAPVAVVSRRTAARAFKGQPALGRQLRGFVNMKPHPFDVVGVVADVQMTRWDDVSAGQVYAPFTLVSDEQTGASVIVRTERPDQVLPALLTLIKRPDMQSFRVSSAALGADVLNESVRPRRLNSWIFAGFAAAALVIVSVGILGLMAMTSARRTREIGIRIAMGATPAGVVRLLLREQLLAVALGLIVGAGVSMWAVKFVRAFLFGIEGGNAIAWSAAIAVILTVALVGAAIPSIRASRIDPSRALRE